MLNNLFLKNINKTNPLISIKKLKLDIQSWYCNEKILHTYQSVNDCCACKIYNIWRIVVHFGENILLNSY